MVDIRVTSQQTEDKFDNAGELDAKIKDLEEGVSRAEQNIQLFSDQVQKQIMLKAELEAELIKMKAKKQAS